MSSIAQQIPPTAKGRIGWMGDEGPIYSGLNAPAPQSGSAAPSLAARLAGLVAEHDDLDQVIATLLLASPSCDDLLITRLKKRKLQLKDGIELVRAQQHRATSAV